MLDKSKRPANEAGGEMHFKDDEAQILALIDSEKEGDDAPDLETPEHLGE